MRPLVAAGLFAALLACLPAEVFRVRLEPLGDGLTFLHGGGGNSLVLVAGERALLFDAKLWPYDDEVRRTLAGAGARPTLMVYSHLHVDHVGTSALLQGATRIGAPATLAALATESTHDALPFDGAAQLPVRSSGVVRLGGEPVRLIKLPAAHTDTDVAAYFPRRRVLATGDVFANGYYPHIDTRHGGSMLGVLRALDELCALDAEVIVPGHGPLASRVDLVQTRDLLAGIVAEIATRREKGESDALIVDALVATPEPRLQAFPPVSSRADVVRRLVAETAQERRR
jgi:cyclase